MSLPSNPRPLMARLLWAATVTAALLTSNSLRADERRFVYSYETTTMPKGMWELEQWMTWKSYDDKDRFEFRTEVEYGVTDQWSLAFYLSDWRLDSYEGGGSEAEWRTAGVETLYSLSDPTKDVLGSALYGEVLIGPEKFALEGKLLLEKHFGPLAAVYNFVLEAEWEGSSYDEKVGVIENTFGLSYQINPSFLVGVEALHEVEFEDWSEAGDHVIYVGPNVSFRKGSFWATVAGLFQATDVSGEPDAQIRVIAGIRF